MAFVTYDRDGLPTQNKKQSIRLSRQAWEIIENDMGTMGEFVEGQNKSGFLNRIFKFFYPIAKTSIAYQLNVYEGTLREQLSDEHVDKKSKNALIKALIKVRESELARKKMMPPFPNRKRVKSVPFTMARRIAPAKTIQANRSKTSIAGTASA